MIYRYDELKQYIQEDFNVFYNQMKFNEKQIYPAILDEYIHGSDPSGVKNLCIHIFVIINYIDKNMDIKGIYVELKGMLDRIDSEVLRQELDEEYESFLDDMEFIESKFNI